MIETRRNFSRRMLLRLVVLGVLVVGILVAKYDYINDLYLSNQLTPVGLIINGGIMVAFLLGLIKVISSLVFYMQEETALARSLLKRRRALLIIPAECLLLALP